MSDWLFGTLQLVRFTVLWLTSFQNITDSLEERRFQRIKNDSDDFEMLKDLGLSVDYAIDDDTPEKGNPLLGSSSAEGKDSCSWDPDLLIERPAMYDTQLVAERSVPVYVEVNLWFSALQLFWRNAGGKKLDSKSVAKLER